ncbi:MAG: phosphoribosylformimino-5-aminoimidazole carboxamide ribotide isomerase, partial [Myxococcota bacterium]
MPFELIPAIDLMNGSCVRLAQGRYEDKTVYGEDPGAVAKGFAEHRIRRLHVVDLDGAKAGRPENREAIAAIVAAVGPDIPVQLGGGIRDIETVASTLELGIQRVILGTIALRDPELVKRAAREYPGQVVVGIDARDGKVAVEGWLDTSEAQASDMAKSFEDAGVAAIVYTDISRDGMLT